MLALVSEGKDRPLILAARNVHTAFIKAAALLDLDVEFIYPEREGHLCRCDITAKDIQTAILFLRKRELIHEKYNGDTLSYSQFTQH
jgi:hypothetical protein